MIENADGISRAVEKDCGPRGLVSWYLMAGLMYYHFDNPILSDGRFDEMGKTLLAAWDDFEHNHKHFLTKEDLAAGTLLLKLENFPNVTRAAALAALRAINRDLTEEQRHRLDRTKFLPPEALRDNAALYCYHTQGGFKKSWASVWREHAEEVKERLEASGVSMTKTEAGYAPLALPDPATTVRVRSRPVIIAPAPVLQVRTRVRPA